MYISIIYYNEIEFGNFKISKSFELNLITLKNFVLTFSEMLIFFFFVYIFKSYLQGIYLFIVNKKK